MAQHLLVIMALLMLLAGPVRAQPRALEPGVSVEQMTGVPGGIGLAADPSTGTLVALTFGGDVLRLRPPFTGTPAVLARAADLQPLERVFGLDVADDGRIFVVGSRAEDLMNVGVVRRGTPTRRGIVWTTVFETAPYPLGKTAFDHNMSAVAVSPDGQWLAVNSGSRTDHGEVQTANGAFPGVREVPLTSAILRVPADATDLIVPADSTALATSGYLFADGIRNSYGLAFDADGALFGTENAGDRDDGEELNWIREGHHYGFPWRIGRNRTPMQDAGYDPDADPLIQPIAHAYQQGFFYNDPTYPPQPEGITFTDPILNVGPDADLFMDDDGTIIDASAAGRTAATFTPHRSPLGLVFDRRQALPGPVRGDAFMLSWTDGEPGSGSLLAKFGDPGEDLIHLRLSADRSTVEARRLVGGFANPISSALLGETIYVLEFSAPNRLWAVTFDQNLAVAPTPEAGLIQVRVGPNPARGNARAFVQLGQASRARIALVDLLGRRVTLLHEGLVASGTTPVAVGLSDLAAGLYFVRVEVAGAVVSAPVVIVR